MRIEFREGEESWLDHPIREPVMTAMGGGEIEIEVETTRGHVLFAVGPGDPCEMTAADLQVFREHLEGSRRIQESR